MDKKEKKDAARAWLLLTLWALVIAFLTLMPGDDTSIHEFRKMDKVIHLLQFFALGFLLLNAFFKSRPDINTAVLLISAIVLGSVYAGIGEWMQVAVPGRTPDLYDLLSDLLGLNLGVFMYLRGVRD